MINQGELCEIIASRLAHQSDTKDIHNRRLENLKFAFQHVRPVKHVEYAFCVWAGTRSESVESTVNEFCLRRDGMLLKPSPYKIVDPFFWKIPDTFGVFVFREQFFVLLAELTGCTIFKKAPPILMEIYNKRCSVNDFCSMLTDEYAQALTSEEKESCFQAIFHDFHNAIQYYYCSSIVDEVTSLHI